MRVERNRTETVTGPADWFTGTVYIDAIAAPTDAAHFSVSAVRFTPGARTAWHRHPCGQTLWVTEGVGFVQRRGGPIEVIRAGDRVVTEPDEEHWHGAAPNHFMSHLAMQEADDSGTAAVWGEHVSDEEYGAAPDVNA
ncbi:MAG: cupin domain-containing protein [Dehalococcoidia bacterium]|nr:cupin domain-containing protein [Dehalococcoidia bacterium]MCA9856919.1 cupin domain-containing protein [Dehalococcoidia bacterium]MCB9491750.1 cupin domain-containing protein [Dehalococcoidia bacterium]